ncbi:MAG: PAS domain-containing protein [Calditrichaeota bacterium]|nr:PAS domain-containing protein [Calditrichota bacterium]MBT7788195.1 PAS domain-containing protein [Calditrichota bacterium]
MRAVIIGGGKGCQAILRLAAGDFLREMTLEVVSVCDKDTNASGMKYARELGISTCSDIKCALTQPKIELIIELTGDDSVLEELYKLIPSGVKLIDHTLTHIFWDLINAQKIQKQQLKEKTELEKKIEKERQFLQKIYDWMPELVVVLDRERNVIRVNERFAKFAGIEKEEVVGLKCDELFGKTKLSFYCDTVHCPFKTTFQNSQAKTIVRHDPDSKGVTWELTMTPIIDERGETEAILSTVYRMTEKKQLRRAIESAEIKFKSFIDSAHDMISIKDIDGKYIIVNNKTCEIFNTVRENFIGKRAEEVLPIQIAEIINRHDSEVLHDKQYKVYDEIRMIDGKDHYYNTIRFPLTDYKGVVIGVCTIARDSTKERELQNQLIQSTKLAAIGKLAAAVAHEINNPLTGILAFAEDMSDSPNVHPSHEENINVIINETMRCREIVRNLLDFARRDIPILESINPNKAIEQTFQLVKKLSSFQDIEISRNLGESLPSIQCDPQQITQVLLNLMLNAADAISGRGKIEIETGYNKGIDRCYITISDNGPGVSEDKREKIFEPFFSTKGTNGLGLAISWEIIQGHDGSIEIGKSSLGGAVFTILLPPFIQRVSNQEKRDKDG